MVSVAVILAFCCLLSAAGGAAYLLWPRVVARPMVLIRSPGYGEQIQVGETVTVHSIARDKGKVTRVEFWADGQLQESQTSTLPGGTSPFPLLAYWQPLSPGTHTLTIRAFNAQGGRAHASVSVEAFEIADRDSDRVADDADPCPDVPGPQAAGGCPDRDGDGFADYMDVCPDETGLPEGDGCPTPSEGDGDGDGMLDYADTCPEEAGSPLADGCPDADGDGMGDPEDGCPDEPGWPEHDGCPVPGDLDADGTLDGEDDCPGEWGLPEHGGCPDDDGDGVRDVDDACPDEPGLPEHHGCPDRDGDGIPDREDLCPDRAGPPESGCPETGAGDRDGDGTTDDVDLTLEEPGLPGHGGAPPPGRGEDADDNGIADDNESPAVPLFDLAALRRFLPRDVMPMALRTVEVEALRFEVSGDYDGVYCYVSLGDLPERRLPESGSFSPAPGVREWDIVEYLGGENSEVLVWNIDYPLTVDMVCYGYRGDDPPITLGEIHEEHPPGDEITSRGAFEEQWFEVTYRICAPFCLEEGELPGFGPPQPIITFLQESVASVGVGLAWEWEGDEASIAEFRVYSQCGGAQGPTFHALPRDRSIQITALEPACEERCDFYVTAYGLYDYYGANLESPPSNTAVWEVAPCPRTVVVTFETLTTHELCCESPPVGPTMGSFGANGRWLNYDASDLSWWGTPFRGLRLMCDHEYNIQEEILEVVAGWDDSCRGVFCPNYWAPRENHLTLSLEAHEDLTFEVEIYDMDKRLGWWGWEEVLTYACEAQGTIPADEIIPGTSRHTVEGIRCDLTVEIQVLEP